MSDKTAPKSKKNVQRLWVGNLPDDMTDESLKAFICSNATKAWVVRNTEGTSKGYGFVDFNTQNELEECLHACYQIEGKTLVLKHQKNIV